MDRPVLLVPGGVTAGVGTDGGEQLSEQDDPGSPAKPTAETF